MTQPNYDHFKKYADDNQGYDALNNDTMAVPFIRILQDLSPQIKKNKEAYIPEAKIGDVCNTATDTLYKLPLKIVVGKFERLYCEWKPARKGYVTSHTPELVEANRDNYVMNEKYQLVDKKTKNLLVETHMYYVLLPDYMDDGICVIAMTSTQLGVAKRFNRKLKGTMLPGTKKKAQPYFMMWDFDVVDRNNDQGDWFGPRITFNSFISQPMLENVVEERLALPERRVDYAQIEVDAGIDDPKGEEVF